MNLNFIYYFPKPIIPRFIQIFFRRIAVFLKIKKVINNELWPIYQKTNRTPSGFSGWPDNKKFVFILRHDVESKKGFDKFQELLEIDKENGFISSFNFVPKKYEVNDKSIDLIKKNGFELGVHGLYHDGKLYFSKKQFQKRAVLINEYIYLWGAVGFYSPSSHHKLDWLHKLNIQYDSSTFDTDPFEPQSDGADTIFPFFVNDSFNKRTYIEIPYTLPQDFTLFILMKQDTIDVWKKKLDWIAENGGVAFLNTHPDYMAFTDEYNNNKEYSCNMYVDFLRYVKTQYKGQYWNILPKQLAEFWRKSFTIS